MIIINFKLYHFHFELNEKRSRAELSWKRAPAEPSWKSFSSSYGSSQLGSDSSLVTIYCIPNSKKLFVSTGTTIVTPAITKHAILHHYEVFVYFNKSESVNFKKSTQFFLFELCKWLSFYLVGHIILLKINSLIHSMRISSFDINWKKPS